jgi:CBS domain-containing protein
MRMQLDARMLRANLNQRCDLRNERRAALFCRPPACFTRHNGPRKRCIQGTINASPAPTRAHHRLVPFVGGVKVGVAAASGLGLDYHCHCCRTRPTVLSTAGQFGRIPIMSAIVRDMLRGKSDVYSVGPDDTVYDALRLMADKNIGAVLVRSDQTIKGILSERDYARKVILLGKTSKETLVSEIMTTRVISVEPSWTADQCMALMTEKRIRHLPVMEQGRLIGVISIGDVVRAVVDEQQFTIDSLQRYITS